jgi:hypothetical protein
MIETDPFLGVLLFRKCPGGGTPERGCLVEPTAMTDYEPAEVEGTDLEPRDARALTECMTVLPEGGDIYTVVGEHGGTYSVDGREGRCTCPDAQYNLPTEDGRETCKHVARVTYAAGLRPVPAWVDTDAVDAHLGEHTDATPRVAVTDGGIVADADTESPDAGERPADCDCGAWNDADGVTLPCWPCYREGFETPNPGAPGDD